MPAGIAFAAAWVLAWRAVSTEEALELLWRNVAYATRYGRATLTEALLLDQLALEQFLGAVGSIVEKENETTGLNNR